MRGEEPWKGGWVKLRDRAIFKISGPDRVRYLNGQVSNDVSGPLHEKAVAACLCSLKGKVEFLVWISARGADLYLDGQLDQREDLEARLDRYLIADDCTITDVTEEIELIHHFDDTLGGVRSARLPVTGFDLIQETDNGSFRPDREISLEEFQEAQAFAAVPSFPYEITGDEFPAELGITEWAVDFHKGCYLGQEVISRIKSVGRVKRFLTLVSAESELEQDSTVRTEQGQQGKVTRPVKKKSHGKHLGLCLVKPSARIAPALEIQEISLERSDTIES